MPTVTAANVVPASAEEIFDFLADYRSIPRVQPQFTASRLATSFERRVGATVELKGSFHGVPIDVLSEIVTYARPHRLVSVTQGTILSRTAWELEPLREGETHVRFTIDYKIAGKLGKIFGGVAEGIFRREIEGMTNESLRRLRILFEGE